eukprot:99232_1
MSTSDTSKEELLKLPLIKLKKKCKTLKISSEGNKLDLITRLINKMIETPEMIQIESVSTTSVTHPFTPSVIYPASPSKSKSKRKYIPIPQLVKQLQEWMEEVLEIKFKSNFWQELKTGVILCELLNKIRPGTCYKYEASDRVYIQRRNIEIYLSGCRALGIHKNKCFKTDDLVKNYQLKSNQRQIINNLHSVIQLAKQLEIDAQSFDIHLLNDNTHEIKFTYHNSQDSKDTFDPNYEVATLTPTNTSGSKYKKKKRKFKLKDDSASISSVETPIILETEAQSLSNDSYMDTKCYNDKHLLINGYFHEYDGYKDKYKFIKETVKLYCVGDAGSVFWALSSEAVDDFLDEEEDMLQKHKQLILSGDVVIDVGISHNNDIVSFTLENVNKMKFIAYVYCKCINNGCIIKRVYNTMDGNNNMMDLDLMDISVWQKQNALRFEEMFKAVNNETKKGAKYFRIPYFNEKLKFMFYGEILNIFSNVNMSKQIEYKWSDVYKLQIEKQNGIFSNVEVYSDNFGNDMIDYDKCWSICLKYSDFYEQFYFVLKLLKLPMNIGQIKIVCLLNIDEEQYNKTVQMDLKNNNCEWEDGVRIELSQINQKNISVSIGIIEVRNKQLNIIQKMDWGKYGIN